MTRKTVLALLAAVVLLAALHAAGIRLMATYRIAESVLAPGADGGLASAGLAAGFLLVRFGLFFLGPGLVLTTLLGWGAAAWGGRKEKGEKS